MMSVARRYLADDSEAEDTVQDALLRLWQLHGRLSPSLDSLSWIIVRNLAIDRLSRRSNNIDIEKIDMADDPVDDDARYARVICLLEALPPVQQTVICMRHMENMSYDDIAELIGATPETVRKMVSRARQAILKQYKTVEE